MLHKNSKKSHVGQLTSANALRNSPPGAIPNCLVRCADILNRRMYIRPWNSPFCLMVDCTFSVHRSNGINYLVFHTMFINNKEWQGSLQLLANSIAKEMTLWLSHIFKVMQLYLYLVKK